MTSTSILNATMIDSRFQDSRIYFQISCKIGTYIMSDELRAVFLSAIQSLTEPHCRASCNDDSLPTHLQELLDQTSRDLDLILLNVL